MCYPNRPTEHKDIPVLEKVSASIEKLPQRVNNPSNKWKAIHAHVEDPISSSDLREYLSKVKKGTAPGVTGLPIELWQHAIEECHEELVVLMNMCMDNVHVHVARSRD